MKSSKSQSKRVVNGIPQWPTWFIKLEPAIETATHQATEFGMPQTVFFNEMTSGWANTNPFSRTLEVSTVFVTVLPDNYFVR